MHATWVDTKRHWNSSSHLLAERKRRIVHPGIFWFYLWCWRNKPFSYSFLFHTSDNTTKLIILRYCSLKVYFTQKLLIIQDLIMTGSRKNIIKGIGCLKRTPLKYGWSSLKRTNGTDRCPFFDRFLWLSLTRFDTSLCRSLNSAPGVEYDQVLNHSGTFLGQWLQHLV